MSDYVKIWRCTECGVELLGGEAVTEDPIGSQEWHHIDCRECAGCSCSGDPDAKHGCNISPECHHLEYEEEPRAALAYEYP